MGRSSGPRCQIDCLTILLSGSAVPKAKQLYSVYKRPTKRKGRFIYYVQFRDRDGNYLPGVSSGQSSRSAARTWATE